MEKGALLRLAAGALSALVGGAFLVASQPNSSTETFDGAVAIVPAAQGTEMYAAVSFLPADRAHPVPDQEGELSISLTNDGVDRETETHWYLLLSGDAILDDARVERLDESSSPVHGVTFKAPWVDGEDFQLFDITGPAQVRLLGTPRQSVIGGTSETMTVAMPKVLSPEPTDEAERSGGVILGEELSVPLLLANLHLISDPSIKAALTGWKHPATTEFQVSTGYSESSSLRIEQAVPDLDRNKWANLVMWEADQPFAASATLVNPEAARKAGNLFAVSFLFFGVALPLLLEGLIHRAPTRGSLVAAVSPPAEKESPAAMPEQLQVPLAGQSVPVKKPRSGGRRRRYR